MKISSWIQSSTPPHQLLNLLPNQLPSGVLFLSVFKWSIDLVFWVFVFVFVCWQYADGCRAIPWSTGSIHLKETISSFSSCQLSNGPQLEVGVCEPFRLHVGMLTYLILYSSCIGLHSCYEVLSNFELVLSCSEDNLTAVFSTSGPGPLNEESVVWIRYLIFFGHALSSPHWWFLC